MKAQSIIHNDLLSQKKVSKPSYLASLVILASFLGLGCNSKPSSTSSATPENQSSDQLLIGEVGAMTGAEATFGISTHQGIELAFKEINAAGGVKGKKLKLVSLDDQGKPEEAATATTRLITQDKVIAVLGEVASNKSLAMAPIAQQYKIPMITPSSTNPDVTKKGDYIFRVCFIDPFQGTVVAKFAREHLKAKEVAILKDVKNDYSVGLTEFFTKTFEKLGGKVTIVQSYSANDIDFKAQLVAIRAKKPDAIFIPGYYTDVGLIARQARGLNIKVPFLGGDGWDSPKLKEIGGDAMSNAYFSNHYSAEDKSPIVQGFIEKYKKDYGSVPDGLAALGYDAAKILAQSLERAKSSSAADLRDAIAATKDFAGVTGRITIDTDRNTVKSAAIIRVEKGDYQYVTTLNP